MKLTIAELPSPIWDLSCTFGLAVDRSGTLVADYLRDRGVVWLFGDSPRADIRLTKEVTGPVTFPILRDTVKYNYLSAVPHISLIGEPRELAPGAYFLARQGNTLAVAPGNDMRRLYFASEWLDPQLEGWHSRLDRVCWIARPTPERVNIARELSVAGIPLDIYSREPWPIPGWSGYAEDEVVTSRQYRYRLVCENSCRFGYHSEKLFNGIRCGCVTIYRGDPSLDLSHVQEAFLRFDMDAVSNRDDLSRKVLHGIERFMFSNAWEIYSFRKFYDRIIDLAMGMTGQLQPVAGSNHE